MMGCRYHGNKKGPFNWKPLCRISNVRATPFPCFPPFPQRAYAGVVVQIFTRRFRDLGEDEEEGTVEPLGLAQRLEES